MSADTRPITPTRFAAALEDLALPTLRLKLLEIRNSIAHLEYSNVQLRPFADGVEVPLSSSSTSTTTNTTTTAQTQTQTQGETQPDQDCVDAIRENEQVIKRMQERVDLIRAEVEGRGQSWEGFSGLSRRRMESESEKNDGDSDGDDDDGQERALTNGHVNNETNETSATSGARHAAWSDGTFQTGVIRNGEIQMDSTNGQGQGQGQEPAAQSTEELLQRQPPTQERQGGRLSDEALRLAMEERMREMGVDDSDNGNGDGDGSGGMYL